MIEYLVLKALVVSESRLKSVVIADQPRKDLDGKTLQEIMTSLGSDRWSLSFAQQITDGATIYIFQRVAA